jgi:hypothetical protein
MERFGYFPAQGDDGLNEKKLVTFRKSFHSFLSAMIYVDLVLATVCHSTPQSCFQGFSSQGNIDLLGKQLSLLRAN